MKITATIWVKRTMSKIERFIVVSILAIIVIVTAITVSDFLRASTRAKVPRAKSDMRSMATALEAYFVDNGTYPPSSTKENLITLHPQYKGKGYPVTFAGHQLTTPIAYITSLFEDPFSKQIFYYYQPPGFDYWILISPGPDMEYQLDSRNIAWLLDDFLTTETTKADAELHLLPYTFDPTNGTPSPGDVFRVKE